MLNPPSLQKSQTTEAFPRCTNYLIMVHPIVVVNNRTYALIIHLKICYAIDCLIGFVFHINQLINNKRIIISKHQLISPFPIRLFRQFVVLIYKVRLKRMRNHAHRFVQGSPCTPEKSRTLFFRTRGAKYSFKVLINNPF